MNSFKTAVMGAMLLFLCFSAQAVESQNKAQNTVKTDADPGRWQLMTLMHTFEKELTKLRPYLVADEKFKDPANRAEIQKSLKVLEESVKGDRPATIEGNPNFSLNFSLMSYHVQRLIRAFDHGGFEIARRDLNATAHFCVTCHTQIPTPKGSLAGLWMGPETEAATFENAEFLFITRRFKAALEKYDELVRKFPKSGLKSEQVGEVFNRKLALFARVMRDPHEAVINFKKDLENKELPAEFQTNLKTWILAFESWKAEKTKIDSMKIDELVAFANKNRPTADTRKLTSSDPELVRALRLSGKLYEFLTKDPGGKHSQEILLNLALIEKQLSQLYWYSLYQSYLRECVLKYPKKPLTKTCFDLYEADVKEQFASELVSLPSDVRNTIEVLRRNL